MIELKHITKTFYKKGREIKALKDISLKVAEGKIFGVIGSSGAGKSTLIRCINLLERPDSGEVIVDQESLMTLSGPALAGARRHIGMIFQHFNLLSSRTVSGNIAFPLELNGTPGPEIERRVNELLSLVGLLDKKNDYPASLSGGQKQRVAIARTLAARPKVLLCDEATSALDPATTNSILALLKDINQRFNITILLITHEMAVVKAICDEVAVISEGSLIEQGSVGDLFSSPATALTREFIASSHEILVPVELERALKNVPSDTSHPLLKLRFSGQTESVSILSEVSRLFDVDNEIISANMDYAQGIKFGTMLVIIRGSLDNAGKTIEYLKNKRVETEVLGYV